MRNMSFFLTTPQFIDKSKTVTRRVGWWFLKPGDLVMGVEKGQGLGKGGKINRLGAIRIISTEHTLLYEITPEDVIAEGFPDMTPDGFVAMFMEHNKVPDNYPVNRIEFEYVEKEIQ